MNPTQTRTPVSTLLARPIAIILMVCVIFVIMLIIIGTGSGFSGSAIAQSIQSFFGMNTTQFWWYITRASGLTGYILLWLSMIWGFAIPTKLFQTYLDGNFTYDFHEYLSLLGLGFALLHIVVLLFDKFLPFTIFQLLIPFIDSYRPFWVGLGVMSFYIMLLVTFTFYIRFSIGVQAFRAIHILSLIGYLGITLHGLFAGTDSALSIVKLLYIGTFLVVLFFSLYWVIMRPAKQSENAALIKRAIPNHTQHNQRRHSHHHHSQTSGRR